MRIISQSGEKSINFDEFYLERDDFRIYAGSNSGSYFTFIGSYATPERAAEVFEEIHLFYSEGFEYPFDNRELEVYRLPQE